VDLTKQDREDRDTRQSERHADHHAGGLCSARVEAPRG